MKEIQGRKFREASLVPGASGTWALPYVPSPTSLSCNYHSQNCCVVTRRLPEPQPSHQCSSQLTQTYVKGLLGSQRLGLHLINHPHLPGSPRSVFHQSTLLALICQERTIKWSISCLDPTRHALSGFFPPLKHRELCTGSRWTRKFQQPQAVRSGSTKKNSPKT